MKKLFILILLGLVFLQAFSQTDTINLEDITISVTPFQERLSESSGSLSIILTNPSESGSTINIASQLNTIPGVFVASGTNTTNRLTIRGIGSRTPYSSNRIRAYYEDIPLTNGDGISTIEDLDLLGISRMEILKGPTSAIYGSGLGGVVKLKAGYPSKNGISFKISSNLGSFNTWKNAILLGLKNNNTSLGVGYVRASSSGYRENSKYSRDQVFIHGLTGSYKDQIHFHFIATGLNSQIPSSINIGDFENEPGKASANWLAIEGFEEYQKITSGLSWKHHFNDKWQNSLSIFSSIQNPYESRPFNILDDKSNSIGLRESIQFSNGMLNYQAGIELFSEKYEWEIYETLQGIRGSQISHNSEYRRYGNLFTHLKFEPTEKLNLEAGINFNVLAYDIQTIFNVDSIDQSGNYSYKPVLSPRFGLNYEIIPNQHFHASAGHGFSAPSLEETLLPEGQINPDLKPESGWNFDAGFRGHIMKDRWYYDVAVYSIYINNMLVTKRITEEIFTGINAGAANLNGLEFFNRVNLNMPHSESRIQYTLELSLFLNKNEFTNFIDDQIDYSEKQLPGIPAQIIHGRLNSEWDKKLELMMEVNFTGKQFMNDANSEVYEEYFIANSRISHKLSPKKTPVVFRINAGINNILNIQYASMILINAPSFGGAAPRYYYPGMPRNFFVGLSMEL